jgi:AraC-like DNA-binding protein
MPVRPRKLAETPPRLDLQDPRGDVVADVLGASLIRHVLYRPLDAHAPWGMRVPRRDRASFYLLTRGSARIEVEGQRAYTLSPGEVAFIPHGTAHVLRDSVNTAPVPVCDGSPKPSLAPRRIGGSGAASTIVAGFFDITGGRQPPLLEGMPSLIVLSTSDPTSGPWLSAMVQLIIVESSTPRPASSIVLERLADVLFVLAIRSTSSQRKCTGLAALSDPSIHEALGLLHARVGDAWTVEKLARRVGLSRSSFAARFTELVGDPPLQYLARWRTTRAAELLRESDEKVETIAELVGYESLPAFSRAFKRWQGSSPATFRRKLEQEGLRRR